MKIVKLSTAIVMILAMAACSKGKQAADTPVISDSGDVSTIETEEPSDYHAGSDIVNVMNYYADCISQGEPMDTEAPVSVETLTDGENKPLYMDGEGNPGLWLVKAVARDKVSIETSGPAPMVYGDIIDYVVDGTDMEILGRSKPGNLLPDYKLKDAIVQVKVDHAGVQENGVPIVRLSFLISKDR